MGGLALRQPPLNTMACSGNDAHTSDDCSADIRHDPASASRRLPPAGSSYLNPAIGRIGAPAACEERRDEGPPLTIKNPPAWGQRFDSANRQGPASAQARHYAPSPWTVRACTQTSEAAAAGKWQ